MSSLQDLSTGTADDLFNIVLCRNASCSKTGESFPLTMNIMRHIESARGRKEDVPLVCGTPFQGGKYQVQK